MKIKKLFEIPVSSFDISKGISMEIKGLELTIVIKYFDKKNKVLKIHFDKVQCYKHTSSRLTKEIYYTQEPNQFVIYDTLVEIEDSEWLNELKELNEEEFNLWKLKHYAIHLDDFHVWQVIASGYDITKEE